MNDLVRNFIIIDVTLTQNSPNIWGSPSEPFFTYLGHKLHLSIVLKFFNPSKLKYTFLPTENKFAVTTKSKISIGAHFVSQKEGEGHLFVKHELLYDRSDAKLDSQVFNLPSFVWDYYTKHDKFIFRITNIEIV